MSADFFDTNVILYLLEDGPNADIAEKRLAGGGIISVQVLNETCVNCLRKAGMTHDETGMFLHRIRELLSVVPLTVETHDIGRAVAERYRLSVYDSMIVAAALQSRCDTLWSEDMQDGLVVEGALRIVNPFRGVGEAMT